MNKRILVGAVLGFLVSSYTSTYSFVHDKVLKRYSIAGISEYDIIKFCNGENNDPKHELSISNNRLQIGGIAYNTRGKINLLSSLRTAVSIINLAYRIALLHSIIGCGEEIKRNFADVAVKYATNNPATKNSIFLCWELYKTILRKFDVFYNKIELEKDFSDYLDVQKIIDTNLIEDLKIYLDGAYFRLRLYTQKHINSFGFAIDKSALDLRLEELSQMNSTTNHNGKNYEMNSISDSESEISNSCAENDSKSNTSDSYIDEQFGKNNNGFNNNANSNNNTNEDNLNNNKGNNINNVNKNSPNFNENKDDNANNNYNNEASTESEESDISDLSDINLSSLTEQSDNSGKLNNINSNNNTNKDNLNNNKGNNVNNVNKNNLNFDKSNDNNINNSYDEDKSIESGESDISGSSDINLSSLTEQSDNNDDDNPNKEEPNKQKNENMNDGPEESESASSGVENDHSV